MPRHNQSRSLPYSAERMMDLVADVGRYPEFIPWCTAARVRSRDAAADGEVMIADLSVGFRSFRETFTSRVVIRPAPMTIDVEYLDGPFRYLHNRWEFRQDGPDACVIDFAIDFEFRSRILAFAVEAVISEAVQRMIDAFEKRADELYKTQAN